MYDTLQNVLNTLKGTQEKACLLVFPDDNKLSDGFRMIRDMISDDSEFTLTKSHHRKMVVQDIVTGAVMCIRFTTTPFLFRDAMEMDEFIIEGVGLNIDILWKHKSKGGE